FRLGNLAADIDGEKRGQSADKEQRSPSEMRKDEEVSCGREQITYRIALLQQAGEESARFRSHRLHRQRRPYPPFSAHPDSIEGAQEEEHVIAGSQSAQNFDHGIE